MKSAIKKIINNIQRLKRAFNNRNLPEPIFTKKNEKGLKIHLGPGDINLQGWVNIDARHFDHVHIVSDDMKLNEFNDNSVDEIYLCHVLEHISFEEAKSFISQMHKKLKSNGILRIAVPSFDAIIDIYNNNKNNLEIVKYALMGGQDYEYNFHKSIYNFSELEGLFLKAGFNNIKLWNPQEDFGQEINDWSSVNYPSSKGNICISLNVKAQKK